MALYGTWLSDALVAWLSGKTIKAMLVDASYVTDPDETVAPTGSEVSGTGYTAGGVDVTSLVAFSYDTTLNSVLMTCSADIDFGTITVVGVAGVVFYVSSGAPIANDLFGASDVADDFVYHPSADGLIVFKAG